MIASRCCKYYVHIEDGYYVCDACGLCCDPIVLPDGVVSSHDDSRDGGEVKKVINIA